MFRRKHVPKPELLLNPKTKRLTFTRDSLLLHLSEIMDRRGDRNSFIAPLGILVTLILTFVVSDFQDRGPIKADGWQAIFFTGLGATALWLFFTLLKRPKEITTAEAMEKLDSISLTRTSRRAVFFFAQSDGSRRTLVYFDKRWDCYFHPHTPLDAPVHANLEHLEQEACYMVGLPENSLTITRLDDLYLESFKRSEQTGENTFYVFQFFRANVQDLHLPMVSDLEFNRNGQLYKWMTIEELLNDDNTRLKNSEFLRYIKDNSAAFFGSGQARTASGAAL